MGRLPPPDNAEIFEDLCLDLWSDIWGDLGAQKNGRSGQAQAGVDVYGRHQGQWVGVQCKQKDGLLHSQLTVDELEKEVTKAQGFRPPLTSFILATTGARDAKVQERARELCASSGFKVEAWGWEEIWRELALRRVLLERIFRNYWPLLAWLWEKPPQKIAPSRLPRSTGSLFGREVELAGLAAAWGDPRIRVLTLVAFGGVGKTSLAGTFAAGLAERQYDGADYFDWSFYSQGTRDLGNASADSFIDAALRFFGDVATADSTRGAWDKGARLAEILAS